MKKITKRLVLITSLAATLQGCFFVAGAAAGAAAIAIVYDHRTIKHSLEDTNTTNTISGKIHRIPGLRENSHIDVTVFNGVVLLTGQTPNPEWRTETTRIAKATPNVDRVYNQISIQGPTSSLTRTSDTWITTKVRSLMLAKENLKSASIKVVTENGVVYLMGIVTRQQADIAVDVARQVSGVQKVVKVFQYKN